MSVKITCINKDNGDHYDPHLAITSLGWINEQTKETGKSSRMQMVEFIEQGGIAYVKDFLGKIAYLVVKTSRYENKFVKTVQDNRETNNLLALSECSL